MGDKVTLNLRPFKDMGRLSEVYRSETIANITSPMFHDVGQKVVLPEAGRWNYSIDISRAMRTYHLLRNQLKLVVLGDCQGWFSSRARPFYEAENAKVPVAMCLTQERSCLAFYETMVKDYVLQCPKMEWVVFAYHTRWVNGNAGWRGMGEFNNTFKNSAGYKFDRAHEADVFRPLKVPAISLDQLRAMPEMGAYWDKAPWGELPREGNGAPGGRGEATGRGGNYKFSPERWAQWEGIVKTLADRKIRVLAYTTPIHPATAKLAVKDKNGTTEEGYKDQVVRMKELEAKYKGFFFFYDYNNGGDNGLTDEDFGNMDHCHLSGAVKCTKAVEAFRLNIEKTLGKVVPAQSTGSTVSVGPSVPKPPPAAPAPRVWTSTAGTTVQATFVRVQGTAVVLQLTNGKTIQVPIAGFSPADQAYIRQQTGS